MYSVIIPSIGRVDYLNDLLASIYRQTEKPNEIIVLLDDNQLCRSRSNDIKKEDICKIIFCKSLNLPQKRNYGVKIATQKNILFSDDDDIWEINKGELTIKSLRNYQVVSHEFSKFGGSTQKPRFLLGKEKKQIFFKNLLFGANIFGGGSAISAWREVLISIPFNNDFLSCEDYDWWIKVLLADIKIDYIPVSLVKYRSHKMNMTTNLMKMYKYTIRIFNAILYKSLILFLTFFFGYIRSSISLFVKYLKKYFLNKMN